MDESVLKAALEHAFPWSVVQVEEQHGDVETVVDAFGECVARIGIGEGAHELALATAASANRRAGELGVSFARPPKVSTES